MDINANTGVRITAYAAALAATFGIAYGVGTGTDPVVAEKPPPAKHEREHAAGTGSDTGKEAGREADGSAGEGAAKPPRAGSRSRTAVTASPSKRPRSRRGPVRN